MELSLLHVMRPDSEGIDISHVHVRQDGLSTHERLLYKAVLLLWPVFLMLTLRFRLLTNLRAAWTWAASVVLTTYGGYTPRLYPRSAAKGSPATLVPFSKIGLQLLLASAGDEGAQ